jgi:hypothetical protein
MRVLLAALLSVLVGSACSRAEKPVVSKVEIDVFEGREVVGWEAGQLVGRLEAALTRSDFTVLRDDQPAPRNVKTWKIEIAARIDEPDPQSETPGSAVVVLSLKQKGDLERFEVEGGEQTKAASNEIEAVQAAAVKALDLSLSEAAAEARVTIDLGRAPDEVLVPRVKDPDPAVRAAAVRLLARRKNPAALPVLLERLESDDLTVLRRTIGLLVDLKDPSAVPQIIEASRAKNPVFQREIVFALASIGGDEAEAYLDVVATGSDDLLVKASAEKALDELRQNKKKQAPQGPRK